jgi:hypothetical protein
MSVSAIIVTRGDVELGPVLRSLPEDWEVIVWDNGEGELRRRVLPSIAAKVVLGERQPDLSVYGRYHAINYASHELIYVQDDDVIVSDPRKLVAAWEDAKEKCAEEQFDPKFLWHASPEEIRAIGRGEGVCCNMPQEFRHDFYRRHALVGFGAVFHRDSPDMAFSLFAGAEDINPPFFTEGWGDVFHRTCDIIFTALTPRILVDVPKENLHYAYGDDRMWRQPTHQAERGRVLELALKVMKEAP